MENEIQSLYFTVSSREVCGASNQKKNDFGRVLYKTFNLPYAL